MISVKQDLSGMIFGRLRVIKQTEDYVKPNGKREAQWICRCECGNYTKISGWRLKSGRTKSCKCLQRETIRQNGINTLNLIPNIKCPNRYDLDSRDYGIGYTSSGLEFYFDKEDYDKIKNYTWHVNKNGYVVCSEKLYLHILIMNPVNGEFVDHIKHNKLDNRKSELRCIEPSKNAINRSIQSNNTSGITGVGFHKASQKWFAYIKMNGKQKRIYAISKEEAINIRKDLENEYFGEFSYANSMKGDLHENL